MDLHNRIIGYQIANENGVNIAGEFSDPSGLPSYAVMTISVAEAILVRALPQRLLLCPTFDGDIEDPEMVVDVPSPHIA